MKLSRYLALACLLLAFGPTLARAAATDNVGAPPTLDTPVMVLLEHPGARAVLEKHLPRLVQALEGNPDIELTLGSSSLRELEIDDDHVIGFTEEMLEAIGRELAALR